MATTREALLKSPLAFTPWGHRGELSDLSLDVNGCSLNFSFDVFGELVDVTGDWKPGGFRCAHDELEELAEAKRTIARLREELVDDERRHREELAEAVEEAREEVQDERKRLLDAAKEVLRTLGGGR